MVVLAQMQAALPATAGDWTVTGVLILFVGSLLKVVDRLIDAKMRGKPVDREKAVCSLSERHATAIVKIEEIVSRSDDDGRPKVYFSRAENQQQHNELLQVQREIAENQRRTAEILSRIDQRLNGGGHGGD